MKKSLKVLVALSCVFALNPIQVFAEQESIPVHSVQLEDAWPQFWTKVQTDQFCSSQLSLDVQELIARRYFEVMDVSTADLDSPAVFELMEAWLLDLANDPEAFSDYVEALEEHSRLVKAAESSDEVVDVLELDVNVASAAKKIADLEGKAGLKVFLQVRAEQVSEVPAESGNFFKKNKVVLSYVAAGVGAVAASLLAIAGYRHFFGGKKDDSDEQSVSDDNFVVLSGGSLEILGDENDGDAGNSEGSLGVNAEEEPGEDKDKNKDEIKQQDTEKPKTKKERKKEQKEAAKKAKQEEKERKAQEKKMKKEEKEQAGREEKERKAAEKKRKAEEKEARKKKKSETEEGVELDVKKDEKKLGDDGDAKGESNGEGSKVKKDGEKSNVGGGTRVSNKEFHKHVTSPLKARSGRLFKTEQVRFDDKYLKDPAPVAAALTASTARLLSCITQSTCISKVDQFNRLAKAVAMAFGIYEGKEQGNVEKSEKVICYKDDADHPQGKVLVSNGLMFFENLKTLLKDQEKTPKVGKSDRSKWSENLDSYAAKMKILNWMLEQDFAKDYEWVELIRLWRKHIRKEQAGFTTESVSGWLEDSPSIKGYELKTSA